MDATLSRINIMQMEGFKIGVNVRWCDIIENNSLRHIVRARVIVIIGKKYYRCESVATM